MFIKQLSPKQHLSFKESSAKINIWEGAVRSGKTYVSIVRFIDELIRGPKGQYALITRTYDSFRRNILPMLEELTGFDVKHYIGKRELVLWGQKISVIGCDDESAEMKIRGPTFMGAYVDEATIIPESAFKMLVSRCAMKGAKIFCTTNPDSPYHWLKRDYLTDNPDVKSWQFVLDDNPDLKQEEKEYLKRQYKGLWYSRFIEGKWVQAEGSIYDFFDPKTHVIDFAPSLSEYNIIGIDYGTSNPCSFVMLGVNRSSFPNIWCEKEYYFNSKKAQRQKTDSEYGEDLEAFVQGHNVKAIYIDPSAASFRQELRKRGIQNLFDAENDVIDGIRFVGDFLNKGAIKICKPCKNLIEEFQSYVWDDKSLRLGVDKPLKEHDHALDALRYALYTHFFNRNTKKIDWDRAYQEAMGIQAPLPRFFQQPEDRAY